MLCNGKEVHISTLFENEKGQPRRDNPEKLATLGTQDTGRRPTKQKNMSCFLFCFFSNEWFKVTDCFHVYICRIDHHSLDLHFIIMI